MLHHPKAKMVRRVPGRVNRFKRADLRAVEKADIRVVVGVRALVEGGDGCVCPSTQFAHRAEMVAMGVRQQNPDDLSVGGCNDRIHMAAVFRTGIDYHRPFRLLQQVGVCTVVGHGPYVRGGDAPDTRHHFHCDAPQRFGFG